MSAADWWCLIHECFCWQWHVILMAAACHFGRMNDDSNTHTHHLGLGKKHVAICGFGGRGSWTDVVLL